MSYQQQKDKHNLGTIQPRTAYFLNKFRTKKIRMIPFDEWENGAKDNKEEYQRSGDTITIALDKDWEPIWYSHR